MRLAELGKRLGFHDTKALLGDTLERIWALLDRADASDGRRAHTQLTLGKYSIWITCAQRNPRVVAKERRKARK